MSVCSRLFVRCTWRPWRTSVGHLSHHCQRPAPPVNLQLDWSLSRELSAGNRPDGPIGAAVLALLSSPQCDIREQAAILVASLAPERAGPALSRRSSVNRPRAAAALLNAVGRWLLLGRWGNAGAAVDFGAQSGGGLERCPQQRLDAAWRSGVRATSAMRERADQVLPQAIRTIGPAQLTGSATRLRAELGEQADLDAIVVLLGSGIPEQRLSAAEALVPHPEYLPRILAAAREDPLLIGWPCVECWRSTRRFRDFPRSRKHRKVPDQRRAALAIVASVLDEKGNPGRFPGSCGPSRRS